MQTAKPKPGQLASPACRGRLVSSVVNFGDPLPRRELARAAKYARAAT